MEPFIILLILVAFIGLTVWIFEVKILPIMPLAEPWNWILRIIFWIAVIVVLWKFVYPLVVAIAH